MTYKASLCAQERVVEVLQFEASLVLWRGARRLQVLVPRMHGLGRGTVGFCADPVKSPVRPPKSDGRSSFFFL